MKHTFILTLILCLSNSVVFTQTEYLGKLNPDIAQFTKYDSIPGIKWISVIPEFSTFDSPGNRYFFRGADQNFNIYFLTMDALTGEVLHQVPYPEFPNLQSNLVELRYCEADGKIYGLHWDADLAKEYLATLDETTGEFSIVEEIPDVEYVGIGLTAFDQINARFIFTGIAGDTVRLYTLDTSGNILFNPIAPSGNGVNTWAHFFNNAEQVIYCIYITDDGDSKYFATMEPSTAEVTTLFPLVGCGGFSFGLSAYCELTNAYTFVGSNTEGNAALFVADLTSETYFVADYWLPQDLSAGDNIIEFEYDQNSGELYALHWEVSTPVSNVENNVLEEILIYPNPANDRIYIQTNRSIGSMRVQVWDMTGRAVIQTKLTSAISGIDIANLPTGVYNLEFYDDSNFRLTKKIVVN
ncbi:MAG: T9SS type A sorting domain-containing protein [Flavobacteriales bacterium]